MMTLLMWFLAAVLAGLAGGAATGIKIGGEVMGNEVAALMGGFFAASVVVPAALLAVWFVGMR